MCPIAFCNYKCLNIGLSPNSAVFYISICYQSQSIHKEPTITVDTTQPTITVDTTQLTVTVDTTQPTITVDTTQPTVTVDTTQPTITVDTTPYSLKCCLCPIKNVKLSHYRLNRLKGFQEVKAPRFLNIGT
jgi:hypothetical protein